MGLNQDRIIPSIVAQRLAELGMVPSNDSMANAERLQEFYVDAEKRAAEEGLEGFLAYCDVCGGASAAALTSCAYCGDAAAVDALNPVRSWENEKPRAIDGTALHEEDLDRLVNEIKRSGRIAAENLHRVGRLLIEIKDTDLWRMRKDAAGHPVYAGFYTFVQAEIGIKRSYATRLISVAKAFSEDDMREFGVSRLAIALRVPPNDRSTFLEKAKNLPTRKREIVDLADEFKEPSQEPKSTPQRHELPSVKISSPVLRDLTPEIKKTGEFLDPRPTSTQRPKRKYVDVRIPIATVPYPVYARSPVRSGNMEYSRRAKSFQDDPFVRIDLQDDLHMFIRFRRQENGDLEALVETREGYETEKMLADA